MSTFDFPTSCNKADKESFFIKKSSKSIDFPIKVATIETFNECEYVYSSKFCNFFKGIYITSSKLSIIDSAIS